MTKTIDNFDLSRVAIIGCPGSGKSTLARHLADKCDYPMYHLDSLFLTADWNKLPQQEQLAIQQQLIAGDQWIIDGNWWKMWEDRLARATAIIYLDYNRFTCISGVVVRRIKYRNKHRDCIANGCRERLDWQFVSYICNFAKQTKPQWDKILNLYADKVIKHNSRRQTQQWLSKLH